MKGGAGRQQWPCDYCGEAAAALYCRADAARLCVACDRHVHAANALSRKHVRAPLCAGCAARPAAARVAGAGEPALLCADCAGDGGGGAPVEGFSGCPSAAELAASWGLDLRLGAEEEEEEDAFFSALDYTMLAVGPEDLRDLYVPCDPPDVAASSRAPRRLKGEALCHQLAEMARREVDAAHSDLSPRTPRRSSSASSGRLPDKQAPPPLPPPGPQEVPLPYTSLLMMASTNCPELFGGGDRLAGDDEQLLWDCTAPAVPPAQVNYKTGSRQMNKKQKGRRFYCFLNSVAAARFICVACSFIILYEQYISCSNVQQRHTHDHNNTLTGNIVSFVITGFSSSQ
jgi:hypothetical protein